jgi:hypothetical protein
VALDCPMVPLPRNADTWQAPVEEPHLRITAPQLQCFAVGADTVAVLWGGGRYPGEWNAPLGDLVWAQRPRRLLAATDLVTGEDFPLATSDAADGTARLADLPVGGNPILVRWQA